MEAAGTVNVGRGSEVLPCRVADDKAAVAFEQGHQAVSAWAVRVFLAFLGQYLLERVRCMSPLDPGHSLLAF